MLMVNNKWMWSNYFYNNKWRYIVIDDCKKFYSRKGGFFFYYFICVRKARNWRRKRIKRISKRKKFWVFLFRFFRNLWMRRGKTKRNQHGFVKSSWNTNWFSVVSEKNKFTSTAPRCPFSYRRNSSTNARNRTVFSRIMPCSK